MLTKQLITHKDINCYINYFSNNTKGKNMEKLTPLLEPGMDLKTCFEIL